MSGEISTIQSLKAVDAWIDVINANINGGVRTAFKSSRLKFSGSNVDIQHAGNTASLPLQFPEPGLTTANTVIDFTQGAITASTENTHLAIQGEGFFLLCSPELINTTAGAAFGTTLTAPPGNNPKFYLTRDGEFRTDQNGFLRSASGYYLVMGGLMGTANGAIINYALSAANSGLNSGVRAIYNDLDNPSGADTTSGYVRLSLFLQNITAGPGVNSTAGTFLPGARSLVSVENGKQSLKYTPLGSTVYDVGFKVQTTAAWGQIDTNIAMGGASYIGSTILSKSLEASNSSMTQSVPELSLAQKLFSALTKVLQTKQTNVDGVLNLVR